MFIRDETALKYWAAAIFAACVLLIFFYITPNMDVFAVYHPIACQQFPNSVFNRFREACNGRLDLILPGGWHWPRAYPYIGFAHALYYYPFYLLYPHPISAFVSGFLLALAALFSARRLLKCRWDILLLCVFSNFFILYPFIQDHGTQGLQCVSIFLVPCLVQNALHARENLHGVLWGLAAALVAFIGFEAKPFFVYPLVGIALITLAACKTELTDRNRIGLNIKRLLPGLVLFGALVCVLLSAVDMYAMPYGKLLNQLSNRYAFLGSTHLARIVELLHFYWLQFGNAANFSYNYANPHPWTMDITQLLAALVFWFCAYIIVGLYLCLRIKTPKSSTAGFSPAVFFLAGSVVLILIAWNAPLSNPHHTVQAFLMVSAGIALCAQTLYLRYKRLITIVLMFIGAANLATALHIAFLKPDIRASRDIFKVHDIIASQQELTTHGIIICADWGTYYIYALYGAKDQMVLFLNPLLPQATDAIKQLAAKTDRVPVFILGPGLRPGAITYIQAQFPGIIQTYPAAGVSSDVTILTKPGVGK